MSLMMNLLFSRAFLVGFVLDVLLLDDVAFADHSDFIFDYGVLTFDFGFCRKQTHNRRAFERLNWIVHQFLDAFDEVFAADFELAFDGLHKHVGQNAVVAVFLPLVVPVHAVVDCHERQFSGVDFAALHERIHKCFVMRVQVFDDPQRVLVDNVAVDQDIVVRVELFELAVHSVDVVSKHVRGTRLGLLFAVFA